MNKQKKRAVEIHSEICICKHLINNRFEIEEYEPCLLMV